VREFSEGNIAADGVLVHQNIHVRISTQENTGFKVSCHN
jgi:hypothetical protein